MSKKISQSAKIFALLKDRKPHRTDEILRECYGSEHLGIARASGRIGEFRKEGYIINSWADKKVKSLWWYQLVSGPDLKPLPPEKQEELFQTVQTQHGTLLL